MVDEVYEVKEYLGGKRVSERGRYRAAFFVARWYTQEGFGIKETRNKVFEWAKSSGNYLKYNVNDIVSGARECKDRLKDNVIVRVSESDVNGIVKLFDNQKSRRLALALLCYAKAHANRDGEFDISASALAEWVGLSRTSISSRYLPELIDLEYIEKVEPDTPVMRWHHEQQYKTSKYRPLRLRINASLYNAGKYQLVHNDIDKLFDEIFVKMHRTMFNMVED